MVQESLPLHTGGRCLCVACVDINEAALSHAMMNPLSVSTPTEWLTAPMTNIHEAFCMLEPPTA